MKFQKDNSGVSVTQEMKDAAIERQRRIEEGEEQKKKTRQIQGVLAEERVRLNKERVQKIKEFTDPLDARIRAYGSIVDQLDLLWHDIDKGRVTADTTSANSWYSHIKESKDNNPLPENWVEKLQEVSRPINRKTRRGNER